MHHQLWCTQQCRAAMWGLHACSDVAGLLRTPLPPSQVRPVNDEEQLAALDTLPPAQMRPEFK